LAYVMVGVGGHAEEYCEAVVGSWFERGGIRLGEIFGGLLADGRGNHGDGSVEIGEDLFLGEFARLVEFALAVAHVAGAGDLRADVVIQIAGKMQQQVADAVAVGIRLAPKLVSRKRRDPLVQASANFFVVSGERGSNERADVWHWSLVFLAARASAPVVFVERRAWCVTLVRDA